MKFLKNKKSDEDMHKCCCPLCKMRGNFKAEFEDKKHIGELTISGTTYQVYLGDIETGFITDSSGKIIQVRHKFTMIEVKKQHREGLRHESKCGR